MIIMLQLFPYSDSEEYREEYAHFKQTLRSCYKDSNYITLNFVSSTFSRCIVNANHRLQVSSATKDNNTFEVSVDGTLKSIRFVRIPIPSCNAFLKLGYIIITAV